jgi:hypothetical protein
MTPAEAFIAAQTEVLRQILRLSSKLYRGCSSLCTIKAIIRMGLMQSCHEKFRAMRPPLFTKAEEPLEADAFFRALEAMFSIFKLP